MEIARPMVCVLTDGSGSTGQGRLESTTRVLERTGSRQGPIYGRMSDRDIYTAIVDQDLDLFRRLADELRDALVAHEATCVVGDAVEGYNPSHDVCRLMINAAVRMANRALTTPIANYDFVLVGAPDDIPDALRDEVVRVSLDDEALARKLESANGYPELASEVAAAIERSERRRSSANSCARSIWKTASAGRRTKCPSTSDTAKSGLRKACYDRVLRFREHVVPVAEALWMPQHARAQ